MSTFTVSDLDISESITIHTPYCQRCGQRFATIERDETCPRCQQLAALEAEIGRAVIGRHIVNSIHWYCDRDMLDDIVLRDILIGRRDMPVSLIARWRSLHAEGAEAEAATERQEGER